MSVHKNYALCENWLPAALWVLRSPDPEDFSGYPSPPAGPASLVGTASGNLNGIQVDLNAEVLPPSGVLFYKVRAVKGDCRGPLAP